MNRHKETPTHLGKRVKPPYNHQYSDLLRSKVYEGLKTLRDNGRTALNFDEMFEKISQVEQFGYLPEWQDYQSYWKMRIKKKKGRKQQRQVFEEYVRDLVNKGWIQEEIPGLTGYFSGLIEQILKETSD